MVLYFMDKRIHQVMIMMHFGRGFMCAKLRIKPMLYIILMKNYVLQIRDTFYGISENVLSFKLFCSSITNPEHFCYRIVICFQLKR